MTKLNLPIESILERDIDILLVEEFVASNSFMNFFTKQLGLPRCSQLQGVWRSISDFDLGETDILLSYLSEDKSIYVLIENKLDAYFQHEQHTRYHYRAERYKETGKCDETYVVLVAPQEYIDKQSYFLHTLAYETIRAHFVAPKDVTKRAIFKGEILSIAIDKLRRGYQAVNSPDVQSFWYAYWLTTKSDLPYLFMKEPRVVPSGSDWINLKSMQQPEFILMHKLERGQLDVKMKKANLPFSLDEFDDTRIEVIKNDDEHVTLRYNTTPLNRNVSFIEQQANVDTAFTDLKIFTSILLNSSEGRG